MVETELLGHDVQAFALRAAQRARQLESRGTRVVAEVAQLALPLANLLVDCGAHLDVNNHTPAATSCALHTGISYSNGRTAQRSWSRVEIAEVARQQPPARRRRPSAGWRCRAVRHCDRPGTRSRAAVRHRPTSASRTTPPNTRQHLTTAALVPHLDRRVSGAARRTTMSRICCSVTACERFFITRLVRSSSNPAP